MQSSRVRRPLSAISCQTSESKPCSRLGLPSRTDTFVDAALIDRIKIMAGDPILDVRLKRKILAVLAGFHRQFKDDPKMQHVTGLYAACGGGKKVTNLALSIVEAHAQGSKLTETSSQTPAKSIATEAYTNRNLRYEREASERADRKARERSAKDEAKEKLAQEKAAAKERAKKPAVRRVPFDFEAVSRHHPSSSERKSGPNVFSSSIGCRRNPRSCQL